MHTMQQMPQQMRQTTAVQPETGDRNWSGEISYAPPSYQEMQGAMPGFIPNTMPGLLPAAPAVPTAPAAPAPQTGAGGTLRFTMGIPQEAVENPINAREVYQGSLKGLLAQNIGHYVVATFLIGTQSPVSWEGFLHSVGNDYLVIFQPDQGRYITGDFYALKFVEFHDTAGVVPPCAGYRRRDGQHIW